VIKNREGVFVVDITVRHEDGEYLRLARRGKIETCCPLADTMTLSSLGPTSSASTLPEREPTKTF
jgi:hypothetical protein